MTGGAGFIGSHLVEAVCARGQRVRVLDDFSSGRRRHLSWHPAVEVLVGDVRDPIWSFGSDASRARRSWIEALDVGPGPRGYAKALEEEPEKMCWDLYYIKHMSVWLDLRFLSTL